uniref:ATP synthetase subunit 8 n=1 Tax=Hilaphura varipes TaxID=1745521 RepID=A0A482KDJ9_9HEMI|nr:ATP synthetase subunit 8 [Hilaphura varipes]
MPQMSPLNWLFLFMYFIMMIIVINSFIYFVYLSNPKLFFNKKFISMMIWMW